MTFDQATTITLACIHSVVGNNDPIAKDKSLKVAGIRTSTALDALNDSICTDVTIGVPSVGEHLKENDLEMSSDTVITAVIAQVADKSEKMHAALLNAFVGALSARPDKKAISRLSLNSNALRRHVSVSNPKRK
jgi:hypothetical protein